MSADKYLVQIQQDVQIWLFEIGFQKIKPELDFYIRNTNNYTDLLVLAADSTDIELVFSIQLFSRKFNLIESYWESFIDNPIDSSSLTIETIRGSDPNLYYRINWQQSKPDMVENILNKVKSDYSTLVLPKLVEYSNIFKLEAIANGNDKTFSLGNDKLFRSLIINKLAGNTNYENFYSEWHTRLVNGIAQNPTNEKYKNYLLVIEKLHEKLKDVKPLANPVLI